MAGQMSVRSGEVVPFRSLLVYWKQEHYHIDDSTSYIAPTDCMRAFQQIAVGLQ